MPSATLLLDLLARTLLCSDLGCADGFCQPRWSSSVLAFGNAGLARALAGAGVGAGALAAHGQAAAMAHAAVAAEVHQALDRHRHLAAQVALDGDAADLVADALELGVGQVLDLLRVRRRRPRRRSARARVRPMP
jgi:uncharacterized metal-binding protein